MEWVSFPDGFGDGFTDGSGEGLTDGEGLGDMVALGTKHRMT